MIVKRTSIPADNGLRRGQENGIVSLTLSEINNLL